MPADMNDYFKKKRPSGGGGGNEGGGMKMPNETPDFIKNLGKKAGLLYAVIGVVLLLAVAKPWTIINSGELGILKTLGKYQDEPLYPGFHFLLPFVQNVVIVDTKVRQTDYSQSEVLSDRRGINQRPPISILDSRGLPVDVELTVQYSLKPQIAPHTIANLGMNWEDKTINPNARDVVRSVIGNYTAEELPLKRNAIAQLIQQGMTERLSQLENNPINLVAIQLRGIVLPVRIKDQIEKVQIAKQEAERTRNEVERTKLEAMKVAEKSRGEAEAKRIEAKGNADKRTIEAKAEAEANYLISKSLTKDLIQMRQIEIQGKFNDALRENKDAKIFLTPGGSTPNIWLDAKDPQKTTSVSH
jgi:regulator of protease activity HflC (stomatin/prohibitin superfamily)